MGGSLKIKYWNTDGDPQSIDLGTITKVSSTVTKRGSIYPIVSQNMQSAFPLETGNSHTYSFSFTRTQPIDYDDESNDSRDWSNAKWYSAVTASVDRWQTRTNGCKLEYTRGTDSTYFEQTLTLDGFIKNITRTYNTSFNEVIKGTLDFTVGTMHVNSDDLLNPGESVEPYDDMYILMSDSTQTNWYLLLYPRAGDDAYNSIESFTITGGLEDPFEHATIKIPKKKLMEQVPDLVGDIVNGRNRVFIKGMGEHSMFVQKVESKDTITIKAYTMAQLYRQRALTVSENRTPFEIFKSIITDPSNGISYSEDDLRYKFRTELNQDKIEIPANTLLYRALQICATMLGCRLFFADNKVWLVDYTVSDTYTTGYTISTASPFTYSNVHPKSISIRNATSFGKRCIGSSSCDPTGLDPVKNQANMQSSDGTVLASQDYSVTALDQKLNKGTINVPELNRNQAQLFGENHLLYLCEPQRAMTFSVKELYSSEHSLHRDWQTYFGCSAMLDEIYDDYSSERVDNLSIDTEKGRAYQKLTLSTYTRQYPKGICEYTFGMIASVDLSDNLSQTSNTLNVL